MALFLFARAMLEGRPIDVFNHGKMRRDFTYIDDIAEGVMRVLDRPPQADPGFDKQVPDPATSWAPYRVFNIGNHQPVELMAYIEALEQALGKTAMKNFLPLQDGDVPATYADTSELNRVTDFSPATPVTDGVRRFVDWYRSYTNV
jgi:UDP-glucuronate 4-epimerase